MLQERGSICNALASCCKATLHSAFAWQSSSVHGSHCDSETHEAQNRPRCPIPQGGLIQRCFCLPQAALPQPAARQPSPPLSLQRSIVAVLDRPLLGMAIRKGCDASHIRRPSDFWAGPEKSGPTAQHGQPKPDVHASLAPLHSAIALGHSGDPSPPPHSPREPLTAVSDLLCGPSSAFPA